MKILWYALRHGRDGVDVVGAFEFERGSVLAGQIGTRFIDAFHSEAEALQAYPQAAGNGCPGPVSLAHLPGEDDPVPGGMYPDDWD